MPIKHRYCLLTTALYYWLTDLVRSWNQPSEFSHVGKQNKHFGPDHIFFKNHYFTIMFFLGKEMLILHLSTSSVPVLLEKKNDITMTFKVLKWNG